MPPCPQTMGDSCRATTPDEIGSSPVQEPPDKKDPAEPPTVIWPACGAFCDIFWWARRKPDAARSPDTQPESSGDES